MIEHGAYVMLMDFYYSNEYLPSNDTSSDISNDDVLMRICCALDDKERDAVRNVVSQFFTWTEHGYINKRVEEELSKRQEISEKRKKAVEAREKKRKENDEKNSSSDTSNDTSCDDTSTATSTKLSITNVIESPPSTLLMPDGSFLSPQQFGEYLWGLYPSVGRRKGHKAKFIEQIKRHLKKGANHEVIIKGTTEYAGYCESTGEYNQDAQRWARDAGWDNEYTASNPAHRPHAGNGNGKRDESIHALASDAEQAKKMLGGDAQD